MPKFLTIGYGDEDGYNRTPAALRDAAHHHDAGMIRNGAVTWRALSPVQVRNPEASGVQTTNGPYLASKLPVAGFSLIEAATLQDAIELVSKTPCAIAHGLVEVWPLAVDGK